MTENGLSDQLRGDHAAIRVARRRQRFARRRTWLLTWAVAWYVVFLVVFTIMIPT